jgi:hypothetical protein
VLSAARHDHHLGPGEVVLFENVSLQLNAGSRYGLVGANGRARPRCSSILAGDEPASDGAGRHARATPASACSGRTASSTTSARIVDVAMQGDAGVVAPSRSSGPAHRRAPRPPAPRRPGGPDRRPRRLHPGGPRGEILEGLGIPAALHRSRWRRSPAASSCACCSPRCSSAAPTRCCSTSPPTTSTSCRSAGSRSSSRAYKGCAVVISHDQRFLDNVATHILDVDYGTITALHRQLHRLRGGRRPPTRARKEPRSPAPRSRDRRRSAPSSSASAPRPPRPSRPRAASSRSRRSRSRSSPSPRAALPALRFARCAPSGRDVLSSRDSPRPTATSRCSTGRHLAVRRGERLASSAPTASASPRCSRSPWATEADAGRVEWGHEVRPGYFAQDHHELLGRRPRAPHGWLYEACPGGASPTCAAPRAGHALLRRRRRQAVAPSPAARPRAWSSAGSWSSGPTCSCSTSPPTTSTSSPSRPWSRPCWPTRAPSLRLPRPLVRRRARHRILEVTPDGIARLPRHLRRVPRPLRRRPPRRPPAGSWKFR